MIICHPLRLIFIKTKKVGGTSFEHALSRYCGPDCIITPVSDDQGVDRNAIGGRAAQNFKRPDWRSADGQIIRSSDIVFRNHTPADRVKAEIPAHIWEEYRKVTIVRNPFDAMVSRYFWDQYRGKTELCFADFVRESPEFLDDNRKIAPLSGPSSPDIYLRYEHLEADISALNIPGLWESFKEIGAKRGHRPPHATTQSMYEGQPEITELITKRCAEEIERFGYEIPKP